jgi:hypothetical protein
MSRESSVNMSHIQIARVAFIVLAQLVYAIVPHFWRRI